MTDENSIARASFEPRSATTTTITTDTTATGMRVIAATATATIIPSGVDLVVGCSTTTVARATREPASPTDGLAYCRDFESRDGLDYYAPGRHMFQSAMRIWDGIMVCKPMCSGPSAVLPGTATCWFVSRTGRRNWVEKDLPLKRLHRILRQLDDDDLLVFFHHVIIDTLQNLEDLLPPDVVGTDERLVFMKDFIASTAATGADEHERSFDGFTQADKSVVFVGGKAVRLPPQAETSVSAP